MSISNEALISFDKHIVCDQQVMQPDSYNRLFKALKGEGDKIMIPRGAGLSYAPASMTKSTNRVINSTQFDRILSFNKESGLVRCEAGISIGKLQLQALNNNWYMPTLPGYPSITIGGCLAFNVHGKSQYHTGNFIECVHSFKMFHPAYGEINCSRQENEHIFYLTIGGMGLTGFITEVSIQLKPATFNSFYIEKKEVLNIYHAIDFLEQEATNWDALYSWHNFMKIGDTFGKGIIYCERFSPEHIDRPVLNPGMTSRRKTFPINMLNYWTTSIMNLIYESGEKIKQSSYSTDLISGSFPIYGKEIYFSLYGKKGFLEYQLVVSKERSMGLIQAIEKYIKKHKQPVGLASLKLFKGQQSYLNFCDTGICLALDVPNNKKGLQFFDFLDELSIDSNAIMNISKDSRLSVSPVKQTYKEYGKFQEDLERYDPQRKFSSHIREQLEI